MATRTRWVLPSYFSDENLKTTPIQLDLTSYLKLILTNEVWKRKFHYGYAPALQKTNNDEITKATVTIHPRFFSGPVNEERVPEIIESVCGVIPMYLKLDSYKQWLHMHGCTILEIEYRYDTSDIPTEEDLNADVIPHFKMEFIEIYHRHIAVLKELSSFLLAALHITFPTRSVIMPSDNPVNDGIVHIVSGERVYASRVATDAFMHEILIERSKINIVEANLQGLCEVWHFNLWPIKRYLQAVESDQVSMDNLLDFVFALEGLFEKKASSDFIKLMVILKICRTRSEAQNTRSILDTVYRIRNDIAHGERSYDLYEYVKIAGKDILAHEVYFDMKIIVAQMLVHAVSKLLQHPEMKNLRFTEEDFINRVFPPNSPKIKK